MNRGEWPKCEGCGQRVRPPLPPKRKICWACGEEFEQEARGRDRIVCYKVECRRKRQSWAKHHPQIKD